MKKYRKIIKLLLYMGVLLFGTYCLIRKVDKLSMNVMESVKNNLEVEKGYFSISNSSLRKLSKNDKIKFKNLSHTKKINDSLNLFILDHKCRMNDTLYSVEVFVDKHDNVIAVNKPVKVF